ncbi:MAG: class I SAM-dependent methyltransferase [bacterium]|nr:class I SAM-dependent methyltransferase [bacterium]
MQVKRSFYTTMAHPFEIEHLEDVDCNLCGSDQFSVIGEELSFRIRQCSDCGLVYVNPQPAADELPKFYADMYPDDDEATVASRSLGAVEKHLSALVQRLRPTPCRLLEVGCGYGELLSRFKDTGWDLTGLEMSEIAADHAQRLLPEATILQQGIEDASFPAGSQDCLMAIAVLEHVKDPRAVLTRLTEWLAPDGTLVLQVPYVAAYIRLKRWISAIPIHFEAPRHLFDFSPTTLTRYLSELGYEDIRVDVARPYASPSHLGALLIWGVKLPGLLLHALTGGRYVYPYAGAFVIHATKPRA